MRGQKRKNPHPNWEVQGKGKREITSWGRAGPSSTQAWLKMLTAMMKNLRFESGTQPQLFPNLSSNILSSNRLKSN